MLDKLFVSAELRQLARALTGDREALAALAADPAGIELARCHRLAPSLALRAQREGPEAAVSPWRRDLHRIAVTHLLLQGALEELSEALGKAGIPWAPLKGMDLASRLYERPEERPTCDLDVLIHPRDYEAAQRALRQQGWRADHDHPRIESFTRQEGYNWKAKSPGGVSLELHFRLWGFVPEDWGVRIWSRSEAAPEIGTTARRLSISDAFLVCAVHIWVTVPLRPVLYWWEMIQLQHLAASELANEVLRETRRQGLNLPVGLSAAGAALLFGDGEQAALAEELLAELRPPERWVLPRGRPLEDLPLSRLVMARLLAGRRSRMGWKTLPRRVWAHPGVVETYAPVAWPWIGRRLWHLAKSLRLTPLEKRLESALEQRFGSPSQQPVIGNRE